MRKCVKKVFDSKHNRNSDFENFVYQSAHQLRGPLATIKGLINLIKIRKNDDELERFIQLIDLHARKLDERLYQLAYLTQETYEEEDSTDISFEDIETRLRQIIERNAFIDFLDFHFIAPAGKVTDINGVLFSALVENLMLYVLSQPMKSSKSFIRFLITRNTDSIHLIMETIGFETDDELSDTLLEEPLNYIDVVKYPRLFHFYYVLKVARDLNTKVVASFSAGMQRFEMHFPLA